MKNPSKLNNLQVLRAFAAVGVVLVHTHYTLPGMHVFGTFGVDIFFVISGYIMASILDRNPSFFLRRRVLRIFPPYWFFTALLFVIGIASPRLFHSTQVSGTKFVESLLLIPFAKPLPGGAKLFEPLLGVGWTLSFEMLFYLSLTLGLVINKKRAIWIGAFVVLSVSLVSFLFASDSDIANFFARSMIFEFIFGILAYYFCKTVTPMTAHRLRIPALALCFACAAVLICLEGLLPHTILTSLPRAVVFGLPSWLLITAATILSMAGWDTNIAWLVLIGDASYMLYLLHFFSLYGIDRILAVRWSWLQIATPIGALVGISASILAAIAFHLAVEKPTLNGLMRRFGGNRPATELAP